MRYKTRCTETIKGTIELVLGVSDIFCFKIQPASIRLQTNRILCLFSYLSNQGIILCTLKPLTTFTWILFEILMEGYMNVYPSMKNAKAFTCKHLEQIPIRVGPQ